MRRWRLAAWALALLGLIAIGAGHFLVRELPWWMICLLGLVCGAWASGVFLLATHQPEVDELALQVQKGVHLDFGKALREARQKRRKVKVPVLGEVSIRQIGGVGAFLVFFVWWLTPWAPIRMSQRKLQDPAQLLAEELLSPVLVLSDPYWPMIQLPIQPPQLKQLARYLPGGPTRMERGWKLLAEGRFDEARQQFQAVLKESADGVVLQRAMLGLAQTEVFSWNFSEGASYYEKLLQQSRQDPLVLGQAAICAVYLAKYAEAIQWLNEALKLVDSPSSAPPEKLRVLVGLLHTKATVLCVWGRLPEHWEEAVKLFSRAKELLSQEDLFGPKPPLLAAVVNNQTVLQQLRSQLGGVQTLHHQARSIWEQSLGASHLHVADSWANLAICHLVLGEYGLAEQAVANAQKVLQLQPDLTEANPLAAPMQCVSSLLARTYADYSQAESTALRALRGLEQRFGPEHPAVMGPVCALALCYGELARYIGSAIPFLVRAEAVGEKLLGKDHPRRAVIQLWQAELLLAQKQYSAAKDISEKALKLALATYGEEHLLTANILTTLGYAKLELGETAEVRSQVEKARRILEKTGARQGPDMVQTMALLAALDAKTAPHRGLAGYKQAISALEHLLGQSHQEHPAVARLLVRAARLALRNRQLAEAQQFLQRAQQIQQAAFAQTQPNHPDLAEIMELHAELLEQTDPPDSAQAQKLRQQARQIRLRHQQEDRLKTPGG
ncbi:MAG: tetratricopeptide repeat protein [Thermoguttaceae bacterium]|nr:tetratricopeptide repeat protein [Thermoguttaceae bacterium]MDW8038829.1 tetratricopeptide repeat protein [Thermoguttaceae bacterium]